MLKASTPVFVLVLSVAMGLEKLSYLELNIVSIISLGVAITSIGELQFNTVGFLIQLTGVFLESARLVLTNILLKRLKLDSLTTLYYVAPNCFVLIAIASLCFEGSSLPLHRMLEMSFIITMIANGIIAFSLNVALVLVIQHSSALSLALAGIVKDILLVTLSALIFRSPVSLLQMVGYSIALLALNLHKEYKKGFGSNDSSNNSNNHITNNNSNNSTSNHLEKNTENLMHDSSSKTIELSSTSETDRHHDEEEPLLTSISGNSSANSNSTLTLNTTMYSKGC
jgi:hypothetical protein